MTPEQLSTGPVLEWTEIDPGFGDLFNFKSLDSGRVIAWAWDADDSSAMNGVRVVYTDNGTDWTQLPLPDGISTHNVANSGDRWLAYGWAHDSGEPRDLAQRVFLSDDRGASWTELNLSIPPDSPQEASSCRRILHVGSASISDEGIVLDLWGYRHSEDQAEQCGEVAPMRLLWSDGSTVELDAGRDLTEFMMASNLDAVENGFALGVDGDVLNVHRVVDNELVSTAATFDGLHPSFMLAAGPAGVAATAFPSLGGQLEASTIGGLPQWRDYDRIGEPTGVHLWLGWSADGTDWGWQSLPDTFGITEGEPWADLGVGRDFVIARVETMISYTREELDAASPENPCEGIYSSDGLEGPYAEAPPVRWFIARVS